MRIKVALLFTIMLFTLTQCKKEADGGEVDLTTQVVGTYTSGSSLIITVSKVNNNTVSVRIQDSNNDETHSATHMTSVTAFTLSTVTVPGSTETYEYSGSGTCTGNAIQITRHEKQIATSSGTVVSEWDEDYNGTK